MDRIGPSEIIVIAILVLIVFGSKRLPDVARSLGRSARVLKSEVDQMQRESHASRSQAPSTTARSDAIGPVEIPDPTVPSTPAPLTTDGNAEQETDARAAVSPE